MLLTYRQTILIAVYSHLLRQSLLFDYFLVFIHTQISDLVLDHSSQVWWRWANMFFTLGMWALEILLAGEEDELNDKWKME